SGRAADAPPRRARRRAAELARAVGVAEDRAQDAAVDDEVLARGQAVEIERPRAGRARDERIVDDGHERRRALLALAADEGARLAVPGRAGDDAEQRPEQRTAGLRVEDHRDLAGVDLARAELGDGARGRAPPDRLGVL